MKTIYLKEPFSEPKTCVVTIGMFDGVHRGHCFVIDCLREEAESRQLPSCVVTFDCHPRQVVCPDWHPQLLSTLDEKLMLLSETGIDLCVVLPFTKELAALSARNFMQQVLKEQIGAEVLLTGYDNHFGHREQGQQEGFDDYRRYGQELGMEVKALPAEGVVNSSLIRQLLTEGRIEEANDCLGYPYTVTGTVVSGEHIGSRLGFPTANLQPADACKLIPANGAYAVKVRLDNSFVQKHAMTNIGRRPTFDGHQTTLETHILQYEGKLYGQQMAVSFCHRLRDEQRFDTPEALAEQLRHDAETTEKLFNQDSEE
ncbi:MAG: bifunctional riboflavin kinase/FAD synthetase [Prevotella sp.]|jgi:riboflavin kinase/FMN adenylyltransferase|nr:bifunctional riboflavin kinase/FAD synthetase [Prevotella sp.]